MRIAKTVSPTTSVSRRATKAGRLALLPFAALLGLGGLGACDDKAADSGAGLEVAGFALTEDDESDDGFTDGAALDPLLAEVGSEALPEDGEVPPADEVDPEALPEEGPDRVARTVLVVWGQGRLDPTLAATPTTWKGSISSDVGALKVLRAVRFERGAPQHDKLVRDEDPRSVSFETITTTHHDGVLVRLLLPRDPSAVTGSFTFATEHFTKTVPLRAILAGEQLTFRADDLGNGLLIASHLPHRCPNGMLRLRWDRKNEIGGVVGGKVYGPNGEVAGYVVGLWGEVDGKRRVKGALLGPDRGFRGALRGTWQPFPAEAGEDGGTFKAVWKGAGGVVKGVMGGLYRVGDELGEGSAQGFWRVRCEGQAGDCQADLAYPEPPTAECSCELDAENDFDGACACEVPPPQSCVAPEAPPAE